MYVLAQQFVPSHLQHEFQLRLLPTYINVAFGYCPSSRCLKYFGIFFSSFLPLQPGILQFKCSSLIVSKNHVDVHVLIVCFLQRCVAKLHIYHF